MGVRSPETDPEAEPERRTWTGPPVGAALALSAVIFLLLVSNGRPIGAGDTRPTERVAASLIQAGDLDLDEYPEIEPPFARMVGEHRVSIYPALSAVLAAPVFALCRAFFALDEAGSALAGKLAASLFSALAAGVLFLAVGLRRTRSDAVLAALLFALGTSVWSTSQALWQHPAAVLALTVAVLFMVRAEDDPVWAGRAGLPLAAMVAARPADLALAGVLVLAVVARWPRRAPAFALWAAPPVLFVLAYNQVYFGSPLSQGFPGALARFSETSGVGHAGLLVSPAKGLLVFTPVALFGMIGLVRAFRFDQRWLAGSVGLAALAHWLLMGLWAEWHGGQGWGPRLLTDALPLLFLFLPEGFDLLPAPGALAALASVGVQVLGAFAYDYRWERLHQPPGGGPPPLWDLAQSPIPFYLERRVAIFAWPEVSEGRVAIHEYPIVVLGPEGSRVRFHGDGPVVSGADPTFRDAHLQRGARVAGDRLRLQGRWDALFLRVRAPARDRRLELRVFGRGQGTLYVGERNLRQATPRWTEYPIAGAFRLRHPYVFATSGGGDLLVTTGIGGGQAEIEWAALVPPGDPITPLTLP